MLDQICFCVASSGTDFSLWFSRLEDNSSNRRRWLRPRFINIDFQPFLKTLLDDQLKIRLRSMPNPFENLAPKLAAM